MTPNPSLRRITSLTFLLTLSVFYDVSVARDGASLSEVSERNKLIELNSRLLELIDDQLEQENQRIVTLNQLKSLTMNNLDSTRKLSETTTLGDLHPIDAFVILHRTLQNFMRAEDLTDSLNVNAHELGLSQKVEDLLGNNETGLENYLVRRGEALLRLQRFYSLDVEVLLRGQILGSNATTSFTRLNGEDCFLLGRIAYDNKQFDLSMIWLKVALGYANCSDTSSIDESTCPDIEDMSLILDYLAYAAYRNGDIQDAIYFTRLWLQYDSTNVRAQENLQNYEIELSVGELVTHHHEDEDEFDEDWTIGQSHVRDWLQRERYILTYEPGEDNEIRQFCRTKPVSNSNRGRCFTRLSIQTNTLYPEIRYEILNAEPEIVRVYDVISQQEIKALRQLAAPILNPSSVGVDHKGRITKFRVAQTAWLDANEYPLVKNIQKRLYHIFGFSYATGCEPLQVVNYKFGGHYGPHYDARRGVDVHSETLYPGDDDDRAATILIYLNNVDEGGSTVFPTLNLTVEPIEASAVTWFNLNHLGYTELHSVHAGCPVFLGSKWIATNWPRLRSVQPSELCKNDPSLSRYEFAPFIK